MRPRRPAPDIGSSRVHVIDDEEDIRTAISDVLVDEGFRVEQAHNGLQAFERAADRRPNVILTELHLPGIDGYQLTRRLKSDPRTASVPVLAVTGYPPFTWDPSRAERAGCDAVLIKPVDPEVIRSVLARFGQSRSDNRSC